MALSPEIHPPNLNADLYKVYQGSNSHRILTFIDIHAGNVILCIIVIKLFSFVAI